MLTERRRAIVRKSYHRHKESRIAAQRQYRQTEKGKEITRNNNLRRQYGIVYVDKQRMRDEQNGLCGLCGLPLSEDMSKIATDHNHQTGKLRKLLHPKCNTVVGFCEKNPDLIAAVPDYLRRNS